MKEIIFATNNMHKLQEIKQIVGDKYTLLSLKDIDFNGDIPETSATIEGNARQKALYIYDRFGVNCFADDTGLEVESLGGGPGVYSARYAGQGCSYANNVNKLLFELRGTNNRKARFRTVIACILGGQIYLFEGIIDGIIETEPHGNEGFGYDPVFKPDGYNHTFAEMTAELKNQISHRGIAVRKLITFLMGK